MGKKSFITAGILLLLSLFLVLLSRNSSGFSDWYASFFYPLFPATFGRLFSLLPFSVFEFLIILFTFTLLLLLTGLILSTIVTIVFNAVPCFVSFAAFLSNSIVAAAAPCQPFVVRQSRPGWLRPYAYLSSLCLFLSILFFIQTFTCFINYNRTDFLKQGEPSGHIASDKDLQQLCLLLISDLESLTGEETALSFEDIDMAAESKKAMQKLGSQYPSLSGYYPQPKALILSKFASAFNLTGVFSPYTTEVNYNDDVCDYLIPYTICHELAHAKGYMKENEAGFIAYLACIKSDSPELRYSGTMNALSYSLSALQRNASEETYRSVLNAVPKQAMEDLRSNQAYWAQCRQGGKAIISQIARIINDSYLKANIQSDGAQSYGQMVDLLLSH